MEERAFMVDERLPDALFAEARSEQTPALRLKELAEIVELQPLLAANPATPVNTLKQLSTSSDAAIRRAVARNPNTALTDLYRLAAEFPAEFLRNPIIPVLHMTQPHFIKDIPTITWLNLLRLPNLPSFWFRLARDDKAFQRTLVLVWETMQAHVSQVRETTLELPRPEAFVSSYHRQGKKPAVPTVEGGVELFLLFVLLFPYTAPMLKEQWIMASRTNPRQTGIALSLVKEIGARTLARLAQEQDPFVLSQVARHAEAPPRVLKRLAQSSRRRMTETHAQMKARRAVASHPQLPPEAIYQLISAQDVALRRRALAHPALEALDLEIMALDQEATVRAALAVQSRLPATLFTQLAGDPAFTVRAALARNLSVPLAILRDLAGDSESAVRVAAAANPRLPEEAQAALLVDAVESVRASLSGNARLRAEHAAHLAHDPSPKVRASLAANPRTSAALFATLLRAEEPEVWAGLARHPHMPPQVLAQLARQGDQTTRLAVAAHTRTPVETLAELARENTHAIWCALASNPRTPLSVLEPVLRTASVDLLYRLLHHPAMLRARRRPALKLLAEKIQPLLANNILPDWLRRVFLQYMAALPVELVELFAASPYWRERYLVARRPHLPEALLQTLAQDGICHVQKAANEALERREKAPHG